MVIYWILRMEKKLHATPILQTERVEENMFYTSPKLVILHADDDSSAICYNERLTLSFMGLKYECLKLCIMNHH